MTFTTPFVGMAVVLRESEDAELAAATVTRVHDHGPDGCIDVEALEPDPNGPGRRRVTSIRHRSTGDWPSWDLPGGR